MPQPRPMLMRALLVVALGAVLVSVAACGSRAKVAGEEMRPRPMTLVKGSCWDSQQLGTAMGKDFGAWVQKYADGDAAKGRAMRDDAAFTTQLGCSQPHAIELYNVVGVSSRLAARIDSYADLLDHTTPLFRKVRDEVNERCAAGSVYAAAERTGSMPLQLGPSLRADSGLRVAWDPFPPDLWARGEHRFVCTFQQETPGTVRYADVTTRALPESARVCMDTPGRQVPCSGPHRVEELGEMILNTAIDRGLVAADQALLTGAKGRYVALSDAEYSRLDRVCGALLDRVSDRPGVVAKAYPGSVDQWPTKSGAYLGSCFALGGPGTPPPSFEGTVFDRG